MKVWVVRYRIQYDMCDAIQVDDAFLPRENGELNVEVVSDEVAERLNREFRDKWPEVENEGASNG